MLKGKFSSRRRVTEEVDAMSGLANLSDVMLVFACGLMAAVITFWRVDLTRIQTAIEQDKLDKIDAADVIESSGNVSTGGLTNKGVVYEDPETGDLYIIEN